MIQVCQVDLKVLGGFKSVSLFMNRNSDITFYLLPSFLGQEWKMSTVRDKPGMPWTCETRNSVTSNHAPPFLKLSYQTLVEFMSDLCSFYSSGWDYLLILPFMCKFSSWSVGKWLIHFFFNGATVKSLYYHGQTWSINKRGEICLVHVFSSYSCISPRHMELMDLFVMQC